MAKTVKLMFVGPSDQFIDGVPQGDVEVSAEEAKDLVASGLYAVKKDKGAAAPDGDPT